MLRAVLPLGALFFLTAAAVLPWLDKDSAVVAAMLPVFAIQYWSLRRPELFPEIAVLFSGLTVDLLSGGPLGFWTSLYVCAWLIAAVMRPWAFFAGKLGRWGLFAIAAGGVVFLAFVLGAIVGQPVASVGSLLGVWLWLVLLYPPVAAVLRLLDGPRQPAGDVAA
jgi:rod shape-determining protein MreD